MLNKIKCFFGFHKETGDRPYNHYCEYCGEHLYEGRDC